MNNNTCCGTPGRASPETDSTAPSAGKGISYFKPEVNVVERDDAFVVTADLPGASGDSIAIDFENGALTVTARVEPRHRPGSRTLLNEYGVGDYRRVFRVGDAINAGGIEAELADGVLRITLPKTASARQRSMKIAVA